jgi:hypothetical protein
MSEVRGLHLSMFLQRWKILKLEGVASNSQTETAL